MCVCEDMSYYVFVYGDGLICVFLWSWVSVCMEMNWYVCVFVCACVRKSVCKYLCMCVCVFVNLFGNICVL